MWDYFYFDYKGLLKISDKFTTILYVFIWFFSAGLTFWKVL